VVQEKIDEINDIAPLVCYFMESDGGYKSQLADLGISLYLLERTRKYDPALLFKVHGYVLKNKIDLIHSLPKDSPVLFNKIEKT
jgi:hypothetical protein